MLANTQQVSLNTAATGVPECPSAETMAFPYLEPKAKPNVLKQEDGGSEYMSQLPAVRTAQTACRPPRGDNRGSPTSTLHASEQAPSYSTCSLCVCVSMCIHMFLCVGRMCVRYMYVFVYSCKWNRGQPSGITLHMDSTFLLDRVSHWPGTG